jgi:hypothetical protein
MTPARALDHLRDAPGTAGDWLTDDDLAAVRLAGIPVYGPTPAHVAVDRLREHLGEE